MNEEPQNTEISTIEEQELPASPSDALILFAHTPEELDQSQKTLIGHVQQKMEEIVTEIAELENAKEVAHKNKWRTSTFSSQISKARALYTFYQKATDALNAGYYLVPDFPMEVLTVRVKTDSLPKRWQSTYQHSYPEPPDVEPARLPSQEGEYVSVIPAVSHYQGKSKDDKTTYETTVIGYNEIGIPLRMMKPVLVEQTQRAIQRRIFDRIGTLPARRKGDPLLIGQIVLKQGYQEKRLNFLIAWWFDTREL